MQERLEAAPLPRARQMKWGFSTFAECMDRLSVGSGLPGALWGCLSPAPGRVCPSWSSSSQRPGPGAHGGDLRLQAWRERGRISGRLPIRPACDAP